MSQGQMDDFGFGTQIRKSPFFDATVRWGAKGFSVYNHMYIPRDFGDPEKNFWNLIETAILCDVAVERQVEITGPDAAKFVQFLTPRDLSAMAVGQCKYVILTNQYGGILNDPVMLRLDTDHFWLSLADSDVLFWAQGVAVNAGYDVTITEPDASPLQLQGPQSGKIMQVLFGPGIADLRYYYCRAQQLDGIDLIVSRTGWSSELGYEIFLRDHEEGDRLYETIMQAGQPFGLQPGHTSTIRRIEGGMLSYQADMDINTNPFELGLDRLIELNMEADFVGKDALLKIKSAGIKRRQIGVVIDGPALTQPNTRPWKLSINGQAKGTVTSAVYSPRLRKNIALAMVDIDSSILGTKFLLNTGHGHRAAVVVETPFYDPKKLIAKS